MGGRIKVIGYVAVDDLPDGVHDPEHATGLTSDGYDDLVAGENGKHKALGLDDLEDIDLVYEA